MTGAAQGGARSEATVPEAAMPEATVPAVAAGLEAQGGCGAVAAGEGCRWRRKQTEGVTALVLMGGRSAEREVSLATGRAVARALGESESGAGWAAAAELAGEAKPGDGLAMDGQPAGTLPMAALPGDAPPMGAPPRGAPPRGAPPRGAGPGDALPVDVQPVEVRPDGLWSCEQRGVGRPAEILGSFPERTIAFLALHGAGGEDGVIQGFLESLGRPYTGSGVESSALCMNKQYTRLLARELGLAVAPGRVLAATAWGDASALERARLLGQLGELGDSLFVKPLRGGSSVNASGAARETGAGGGPAEGAGAVSQQSATPGLGERLEMVFAGGDDALVERTVSGIEATCAVLETAAGGARSLPPVEIRPTGGRFFDYQQKYAADGALELCPPQNLTPQTQRALADGALALHLAAGCRGATRTDFIVPVSPAGQQGQPVLLEINTLPGMTERSILPQAARVAGLSFRELCLELLALARPREWSR